MQWKERPRIMAAQMDNLRGLLGIRRMNRVPNARIRELCGVTKGVFVFAFYYGLTSICDPMVDTQFISKRGSCVTCRRKHFFSDCTIGLSGGK